MRPVQPHMGDKYLALYMYRLLAQSLLVGFLPKFRGGCVIIY